MVLSQIVLWVATQQCILLRHAASIRIVCIAYSEHGGVLITADESGRVLIHQIVPSEGTHKVERLRTEIRSEESVTALLPNPLGNRVLIYDNRYASNWTMEGEQVGFPIPLPTEDEGKIISIHPTRVDNFIVICSNEMRTYSWADGREIQPSISEQLGAISVEVTPPSPQHPRISQPRNLTDLHSHQRPINFVASLSNPKSPSTSLSASSKLEIWPASSLSGLNPHHRPQPLPDLDNLSPKVHQIVAMAGDVFLFLDLDHWVCSLDLTTMVLSAHSIKRHFFLLSEWQRSDGDFNIQYLPLNQDFLIAFKDRLLVVQRGLEFAEPWLTP